MTYGPGYGGVYPRPIDEPANEGEQEEEQLARQAQVAVFLDAILDAPSAQEWTRHGGTTNAPSGQEEAELLELGRRVAMDRGYQSVLFDAPPTTPEEVMPPEQLSGPPPPPTTSTTRVPRRDTCPRPSA